jgi:hypothetical protein
MKYMFLIGGLLVFLIVLIKIDSLETNSIVFGLGATIINILIAIFLSIDENNKKI